jgi:lipopolysaccharide/colanic/teichoic acid biosynthesis glycosyltransferase
MKLLSYLMIKRLLDIIFSSILFSLFIPIMLLSMVLIKIESKGPALFLDRRVGLRGNAFNLYKLRTMYHNSPRGFVIDNDPRVTKIGSILRKASLDEIPQFINVLKGEMSLVGPRPDILKNYQKYDEKIKKRLTLRPGITGWAQVNGRSKISWDERYRFDLEYIDNVSFCFDLKILLLTIKNVFLMKNINLHA